MILNYYFNTKIRIFQQLNYHKYFGADVAGKKLVFYIERNIKPNIFAAPPATFTAQGSESNSLIKKIL